MLVGSVSALVTSAADSFCSFVYPWLVDPLVLLELPPVFPLVLLPEPVLLEDMMLQGWLAKDRSQLQIG
jgi:hypothetical protein